MQVPKITLTGSALLVSYLPFSTIDHILDTREGQRAMDEISRLTKQKGYVAITVPNKWNFPYYLWSKRHQTRGTASFSFEYQFTPIEFRKLLRNAGLPHLRFVSKFIMAFSICFHFLKVAFKPIELLGFRMGYIAYMRQRSE
jgi:hypothetical protein